MASAACVNNLGFSPENFLSKPNPNCDHNVPLDPNPDFEFRLEPPLAAMLPADQLFSDGKLLPLIHLSHTHTHTHTRSPNSPNPPRSSPSHNTPFKHLLRLRHFLHRPSISKYPPPSNESRRSVSSSSSSAVARPRLSLDSRRSVPTGNRGISVESPRLSSSGKIVFERFERSSSTPAGFNQRGIQRSNSANLTLRVTPVLNLPAVSSLRTSSSSSSSSSKSAFAQFFSSSSSKETTNCCNKPYRHVTHARNRSYPI